jgi:hypothetical protein
LPTSPRLRRRRSLRQCRCPSWNRRRRSALHEGSCQDIPK